MFAAFEGKGKNKKRNRLPDITPLTSEKEKSQDRSRRKTDIQTEPAADWWLHAKTYTMSQDSEHLSV